MLFGAGEEEKMANLEKTGGKRGGRKLLGMLSAVLFFAGILVAGVFLAGGDLESLAEAFKITYRMLKRGWSLFDQRCESI